MFVYCDYRLPTGRARMPEIRSSERVTEPAVPDATRTDVVDTIISWGQKVLAYHHSGRASNGPIEGINNLHPSPTPSRSRVHEPRQLRSPRSFRNMNPDTGAQTRKTHEIAQPQLLAFDDVPRWGCHVGTRRLAT